MLECYTVLYVSRENWLKFCQKSGCTHNNLHKALFLWTFSPKIQVKTGHYLDTMLHFYTCRTLSFNPSRPTSIHPLLHWLSSLVWGQSHSICTVVVFFWKCLRLIFPWPCSKPGQGQVGRKGYKKFFVQLVSPFCHLALLVKFPSGHVWSSAMKKCPPFIDQHLLIQRFTHDGVSCSIRMPMSFFFCGVFPAVKQTLSE